jgi:hypothetical protein
MDIRERMGWYGLDWSGGSCEHGNEPSGSIKCWEFVEWLRNWQLLKKASAPCVSEWALYSFILAPWLAIAAVHRYFGFKEFPLTDFTEFLLTLHEVTDCWKLRLLQFKVSSLWQWQSFELCFQVLVSADTETTNAILQQKCSWFHNNTTYCNHSWLCNAYFFWRRGRWIFQ